MNAKWKKFFSYYKPYKKALFLDLLAATIMAAISLVLPLIIRFIVNDYLPSNPSNYSLLIILAFVLIGLLLIEMACNYYVIWKGHSMAVSMEVDIRQELFNHYQKLSFSFYDSAKVGTLMSRSTSDLFQLVELYHHGPEDVIISAVKFIGAFVILITINVPLTLLVFTVLPLMILFAKKTQKKMSEAYLNTKKEVGKLNAALEDNLNGQRVVKSFANEAIESSRFANINAAYRQAKHNSYYYMAIYNTGMNAMVTLITIIAAIGGAFLIAYNQLSVADLLTFTLYIANFTDPIKKIINFAENYQDGMSGFTRFYEIINLQLDVNEVDHPIELSNIKGNVKYNHVSFAYENCPYLFNDLNLSIPAGESIALVGSSGVGKTSLCALLPRFYNINSGSITIDGIDISQCSLKSLRDNIGIVQQDIYLFNGTILDNIAYGKPTASQEEIVAAAKAANAHEFIMSLEKGYATDIGSHGVKLSGGQKQRIAIARVFLKDPRILIFDEATSALDNESEHYVQKSLNQLAKNRTTIVIAHRLSTIANSKRIIVLDEHGIAEQGNHQQLMEKKGIYYNLVNIQYETLKPSIK